MDEQTQARLMQIGMSIMADPEMVDKVCACATPQEAFELVKAKVGDLTYEDFVAAAKHFQPMIPDVPDEQLMETVSGKLMAKIRHWLKEFGHE